MKKHWQEQARVCPNIRTTKAKGEWAEMMFMAKATALGFTVCHPYGDNQPFDFLVFYPGGRAWRVQIKSAWSQSDGMFRFKTTGCGRRRYRRNEVDFIIAYIVPHDAWYVIPRRQAARDVCYVAPQKHNSRGKYEKFRESWDLLLGREPGYGIELQACADSKCFTTEDTEDAEGVTSG